MNEPFLAIISSGRPQNVPGMADLLGDHWASKAVWIVGDGQAGDYEYSGARHVVEGGGLIASRNFALEQAFRYHVPCLQLSDDLRRLAYTEGGNEKRSILFPDALRRMMMHLDRSEAKLAGVAPTDNAFFFNAPISTDKFILGDWMLVEPSEPRFDPALRLKEDYDFTLQHLSAYGSVVRVNGILATFTHRSNSGGAVAYRTPMIEDETIEYLTEKWPGKIVPNPKRPHEVLMRWRGAGTLEVDPASPASGPIDTAGPSEENEPVDEPVQGELFAW